MKNEESKPMIKKSALEDKIRFGNTVELKACEYQKLVEKHGKEDTERMIAKLDTQKNHTGKQYASDYRAILNWVEDWLKQEKRKKSRVLA
jgi:hypothetical protein